jgi:hypothetical protein
MKDPGCGMGSRIVGGVISRMKVVVAVWGLVAKSSM